MDGLTRSREAILGRPLQTGLSNNLPRKFEPALTRNWDTAFDKIGAPRWLARMDRRTRLQVFVSEAMEGISYGRDEMRSMVCAKTPSSEVINLVRPGAEVFRQQARRVESWASLRAERAPEILSQLGPQFGYWSSVLHLNPEIYQYTGELMAVALEMSSSVIHRVKFELATPRPSDYSARIQPMFENPGFFAWPSGHATQAFMMAELLSALAVPKQMSGQDSNEAKAWWEQRIQLVRLAERIATNRVVAGVHFPIDSEAGCEFGIRLARHLLERFCGLPIDKSAATFEVNAYEGDAGVRDFDHRCHVRRQSKWDTSHGQPDPDDIATLNCSRPGTLGWLWRRARAEWHEPGID